MASMIINWTAPAKRPLLRVFVVLALVALTYACGGDGSGNPVTGPVSVAAVHVSPANLSLVVDQTGTLVAEPRDAAGNALAGRTIVWSSSDTTIARVSQAGLVTGTAVGSATITASSEGKSGSASVTVGLAPVATVVVTPNTLTLSVGQTGTLVAEPRNAAGNALAGRAIVWTSSDTTVARVSQAGVVVAIGVGSATITATSEGKSGTALATVSPPAISVSVGNWTSLGPHDINSEPGRFDSGKLQAFAVFTANPNILYVGGGLGSGNEGPYTQAGAFATTDGAHWSPINSGLTDHIVNVLWVDQTNSQLVLAGTEITGIFRSTNGGQSWSLAGNVGTTSEFVSTGSELFAATARGVARSTDAGATWSILLSTASKVRALAAGGGAMIAGLDDGTIVMRSSPDAPWQTVRTNPGHTTFSVVIDKANPLTAYAIFDALSSGGGGLIGTTDGGASWFSLTPPSCGSLQGGSPQALAMGAASHVLYVGCNGSLATTSNAGQSWNQFRNPNLDIRRLLVLPDDRTLIAGTDQGVFRTNDNGITWTGLSAGVGASILTGVAVHGSTILTAVQDFQPILSFDGGTNWRQPFWDGGRPIGEDGTVLINPANPNYCYAYTRFFGYQYSTDGCHTFWRTDVAALQGSSSDRTGDVLAIDALRPSRLYAGSATGVFRSDDWGVTWAPTNWPTSSSISAIAVDPSDSLTIYVSTSFPNGKLIRTRDGGATWTDLSSGLDLGTGGGAAQLSTIAVNPRDPRVILVGSSGLSLRRSVNRGDTFVRVESGIKPITYSMPGPENEVFALRFHTTSVLALATGSGVYVSSDLGDHWVDVTQNSVSSYFSDVVWDGGFLYAATYGAGVQRAPVTVLNASRISSNRVPATDGKLGRTPTRTR